MTENKSKNNSASKFSSLLAGAKVESKKSINDFLDNRSENDKETKGSINNSNDGNETQQEKELKSTKPKQQEVALVEKKAVKDKVDINTIESDPGDDKKSEEQRIGGGGSSSAVIAKDEPPRKNEAKKNDYDRFIKKNKSTKTEPIFITEHFDTQIGKIVSQIGEKGLTKSGYVENILVQHFEIYGEEIKLRRKEALQKLNDEL